MGIKLTILGKEYGMPIENIPGTPQPAKRRTWDHVSFTATALVRDELTPRGAPGQIAKRDLQRYYDLLREAREAAPITRTFALNLVDAYLSLTVYPVESRDAWEIIVQRAVTRSFLGEPFPGLTNNPTPALRYALIDAAERASRLPRNEREERLGEFFTLIEEN
jgi:hypothetical protein